MESYYLGAIIARNVVVSLNEHFNLVDLFS